MSVTVSPIVSPIVSPTGAAPRGTIHDVGYRSYDGPRLPQSRRAWAITRNVIAVAWRSRWGVKVPLAGAALTVLGAAIVMIVSHRVSKLLGGGGGVQLLPGEDFVVYHSLEFFSLWGFLLALTVACSAIANDLRLGAFSFYFSRPIRPIDYVRGKLCGLFVVIGLALFAGPVLLSLVRLFLVDSLADAAGLVPVVLRAALLGLLATAAHVLPAAGLGALLARRIPAQAIYAIYFVVIGPVLRGATEATGETWPQLFSASADLTAVAAWLFGVKPQSNLPPAPAALAALIMISALGVLAVWLRVRNAETAGLASS